MADDKGLEQQYRKNLMIVASVVFIYSIAGGRMENDLSLFGAKIIFSHPVWLEYAMVIMMCFFWWRHRQVSYNIRSDFVKKVYSNLIIPKWVYRKLMRNGKKESTVKFNDYGWEKIHKPLRSHWDAPEGEEVMYLSHGVLYGGVVAYLQYENESAEHLLSEREIQISWLMRLSLCMAYVRSFIMVSYKKSEFGDGVLPTIFFVLALAGWVINHFQITHIAM